MGIKDLLLATKLGTGVIAKGGLKYALYRLPIPQRGISPLG